MAEDSGRLRRIVHDAGWLARASARDGMRRAVAQRMRRGLDIEHVDSGLMGAALGEIDGVKEVQRRLDEEERSLAHGAAVLAARVTELEAGVAALGERQAELIREAEALVRERDDAMAARAAELEQRAGRLEQERSVDRSIAMHTRWLRHAPASERLISVILPTRDRPGHLAHALRSVRAQTHTAWELLVVDDSVADDGTVARIAADLADERVRVLRNGAGNVAAARNAGLAAARGDLIAYLDDDNFWYPEWLAAVADAFERHPGAPLVYGALTRAECTTDRWFPAWDRVRLERANYVDQNVLAHPRDHPEARFSEELEALVDWDLVLRLTDDAPGVPVPVLAAGYTTDAPDRISEKPHALLAADTEIRRRTRARRPPRVLGLNQQFPLLSETYILDELGALAQRGAELGFVRTRRAVAPMHVPWPQWSSLDEAVADWQPDIAVLHWVGFALEQLPELERHGLPFAVRTHGFDVHRPSVETLLAHPLCIGVFAYPTAAQGFPGTLPLPLLFTSVDRLPPAREPRDLVMSASAGLPKKDFGLLFEAYAQLQDVKRRIVIAGTEGHEDLPGDLLSRCKALEHPPLVQVNLPREDVFALLGRTALFVYTLAPESPFGMPMSVAEAMASGCSVVLPDRPECRAYAGAGARFYRTAGDIAGHACAVLAGGPAIERERRMNRELALERFCDPALGDRFHRDVTNALARFRGEPAPAPDVGHNGDGVLPLAVLPR